jgi:hypothetical protein
VAVPAYRLDTLDIAFNLGGLLLAAVLPIVLWAVAPKLSGPPAQPVGASA